MQCDFQENGKFFWNKIKFISRYVFIFEVNFRLCICASFPYKVHKLPSSIFKNKKNFFQSNSVKLIWLWYSLLIDGVLYTNSEHCLKNPIIDTFKRLLKLSSIFYWKVI